MAPSVRRKKIEKEGELNRRQREAERLANELFFTLKRDDNRYSLCRTVGLKGGSARRDNLSLDQVEVELEKWKLRGYHGG